LLDDDAGEQPGGARHGSDFQNLHRNKRAIQAMSARSSSPRSIRITRRSGSLWRPRGGVARQEPVRPHPRAHQGLDGSTTKVKGMFVRPEQVAEIGKRHPELGRLRLVVSRAGETDVMTLRVECASPSDALRDQLSSTLRTSAKLGGNVELVGRGSLPNDGKVIADER
jgi:phenylacetate-CoA ligase